MYSILYLLIRIFGSRRSSLPLWSVYFCVFHTNWLIDKSYKCLNELLNSLFGCLNALSPCCSHNLCNDWSCYLYFAEFSLGGGWRFCIQNILLGVVLHSRLIQLVDSLSSFCLVFCILQVYWLVQRLLLFCASRISTASTSCVFSMFDDVISVLIISLFIFIALMLFSFLLL